jgi:hypothetical protein
LGRLRLSRFRIGDRHPVADDRETILGACKVLDGL